MFYHTGPLKMKRVRRRSQNTQDSPSMEAWEKLPLSRRKGLEGLGFTAETWNKNLSEVVPSTAQDFHVRGVELPRRFSPMGGDKAKRPVQYEGFFDREG